MFPPHRRRHGWAGAAAGLLSRLAVAVLSWPVLADERVAGDAAGGTLDPVALARQAALDRAGFSPGILDGRIGRKTQIAVRAFQADRGLTETGAFDPATVAALAIDEPPPLRLYTVTAADLADVGGPLPDDWNAKAKLKRLRYETLAALLAERGHCTQAALAGLNPGRAIEKLRPGDEVRLPNVTPARATFRAAEIEVHLGEKLIRVLDERGRTRALFHCSIARLPEKRPTGETTVVTVVDEPVYVFKPEMWPEVRNVKQKLIIPAGPRNPVGLCWIGLGRPGYGIHGTPQPELIGKTGSHGCFRLTNWDAQRLGRMVRAGLRVRFVE